MEIISVQSPEAPPAVGGYAQALEVRGAQRLLFISGQVPQTVDGEVPVSFEAQARRVWANVLAQLNAAGMNVTNLVKVTTYLGSREHATVNREVRQAVLGDHTPALTVVIVGIFDEAWLIEIEAIAAA